jgi:hypothetical protein
MYKILPKLQIYLQYDLANSSPAFLFQFRTNFFSFQYKMYKITTILQIYLQYDLANSSPAFLFLVRQDQFVFQRVHFRDAVWNGAVVRELGEACQDVVLFLLLDASYGSVGKKILKLKRNNN